MKSNETPGGSVNPGFSRINRRVNSATAASMNTPLEADCPDTRNQTRATSTSRFAACEISHVVTIARRLATPLFAPVARRTRQALRTDLTEEDIE